MTETVGQRHAAPAEGHAGYACRRHYLVSCLLILFLFYLFDSLFLQPVFFPQEPGDVFLSSGGLLFGHGASPMGNAPLRMDENGSDVNSDKR
ncbi:MAG: hypothetical protein JW943_02835 [Deltaproteobacteria bacterium]|nr:hypothetical protein [Deltaproteobacteria bacterium]